MTLDVVGLAEVAELLGIGPRQARRIVNRPDFPEPARLTAGRVWNGEDVRAWIDERRPQATSAPCA